MPRSLEEGAGSLQGSGFRVSGFPEQSKPLIAATSSGRQQSAERLPVLKPQAGALFRCSGTCACVKELPYLQS